MIWQNLSHQNLSPQNLSPNELSPHGRAQRIELTGSDRAIARWSVRHVAKICFELRYIENPAPSLHSSSSGGNCVRFVDALISPVPGGLLRIPQLSTITPFSS